jgi:ABC-type nitrate/sulfonate/bicarbonate transport system permease component
VTVREEAFVEARRVPAQARTHTVPVPRRSRVLRAAAPGVRLYQVVLLAGILAAWELGGRASASYTFAPPTRVITAAVGMARSGELPRALGDSTAALLLGFGFAAVVGVALGYAMGWWRTFGRTLDPFIAALYVVPVASLVPAVIVWFGLGLSARVLVIFLFAVFEPLVNAYAGVKAVDPLLVDVARSFGARRDDLVRKVVLPDTLPFVFAGLRMAASRAVKGMVLAEMLFSVTGLGGLLIRYAGEFRMDRVLATVVTIALLGVALTTVVQVAERRALRWRG